MFWPNSHRLLNTYPCTHVPHVPMTHTKPNTPQ